MIKLVINDENITDFFNCNPLEITCLEIFEQNNIELILNNLHKFVNLQELYLDNNKITEIKGLDNLVNLLILNLTNNQITEIKGLNNLVNLQELYLYNNQITEIKGLDNLANLQYLILSINKIKEIKGLDNLVNLRELYLSINQITDLKGLDNLVNLRELYLIENKITEIKGLDKLVNLLVLELSDNKITEIKGLDKLVNLQNLELSDNEITEIKCLDNLVNLQILVFENNQITDLPLNLCNLRNIYEFNYFGNPVDFIPLPVQRWLNRMKLEDNNIYTDKQNVHNHTIQASFRNSLTNLLKDNPTIKLDTVKNEIISSNILTEQTKREILNYCDDTTEHSTYLITYSDLLIYVWSRIRNKHEIIKVLNQEITDGLCMCFTGRMTRLINVLVGFYDDIELQISDSEQIANIIKSLKIKFDELLKEAVKKELLERQYSEANIRDWLECI